MKSLRRDLNCDEKLSRSRWGWIWIGGLRPTESSRKGKEERITAKGEKKNCGVWKKGMKIERRREDSRNTSSREKQRV